MADQSLSRSNSSNEESVSSEESISEDSQCDEEEEERRQRWRQNSKFHKKVNRQVQEAKEQTVSWFNELKEALHLFRGVFVDFENDVENKSVSYRLSNRLHEQEQNLNGLFQENIENHRSMVNRHHTSRELMTLEEEKEKLLSVEKEFESFKYILGIQAQQAMTEKEFCAGARRFCEMRDPETTLNVFMGILEILSI